jgi:hypothetical protein
MYRLNEMRIVSTANRTRGVNIEHVEYYLQCEECLGMFWGRKKNGKFCRVACRVRNFRNRN